MSLQENFEISIFDNLKAERPRSHMPAEFLAYVDGASCRAAENEVVEAGTWSTFLSSFLALFRLTNASADVLAALGR